MDYLTSLVFIEISRIHGHAIDRELQRSYPIHRGSRPSFALLRAPTIRSRRDRRSDDVCSNTLP
jgi:hypothetical protein